jgi:uncharacterized protein YndB with AHSA1/START domain
MKTIDKNVTIRAPAGVVWEFLTNPSNLPSVWPSMTEVENVEVKPDGSHSFDFKYRMAGIPFHGHSATVEVDKNRRLVSKTTGGVPSTFTFIYEGRDAMTTLSMHCEYELPGKILGKLAEPLVHRINEREAEHMLANVKDVLEHRVTEVKEVRPTP